MKHFVKRLTPVMLICVVLVGIMTFGPRKAQAATTATLDTVYQYKIVNDLKTPCFEKRAFTSLQSYHMEWYDLRKRTRGAKEGTGHGATQQTQMA